MSRQTQERTEPSGWNLLLGRIHGPVIAAVVLVCFGISARIVESVAAGQSFNAPQGHVENVRFEQIPGGVINILYDLVSPTPDAVFTITVKASDDGGRTFNLTPSAITGDVTGVKPGPQKKIVWRSGQDVAVLAFDQLRFDVVATAGPVTASPAPQPSPAAQQGGINKKILIPAIAGGAAVAAYLLLKGDSSETTTTPPPPACSFSASPTSFDVAAGGTTTTVNVTVSPSGCAPNSWTATSAGFVTVAPTSGNGNGTVTLTIAQNPGAARSATVSIAGQNVVVNQGSGLVACTFSVSPTSVTGVAAAGETRQVTLTASPAGCSPDSWTASSNQSFVVVAPTSGNGNATVTLTIAANGGSAARTATVTIAGQAVQVSQNGLAGCTAINLTPSPLTVQAAGGQQQFTFTLTPAGCAPNTWTAVITNAGGFMTNLTPNNGSGNPAAPLTFSASLNQGTQRSGTIRVQITGTSTISDLTVTQTIQNCSYQVSPPTASVGLGQTDLMVTVTPNLSTCVWSGSFNPNPTNMLRFGNMTTDGGLTALNQVGTKVLGIHVNALATGTRTGTFIVTDVASNTVKGSLVITQH